MKQRKKRNNWEIWLVLIFLFIIIIAFKIDTNLDIKELPHKYCQNETIITDLGMINLEQIRIMKERGIILNCPIILWNKNMSNEYRCSIYEIKEVCELK